MSVAYSSGLRISSAAPRIALALPFPPAGVSRRRRAILVHPDDGVVDDGAQGDHQSRDDHEVDRGAEHIQDGPGGDHRQEDRRSADQGRAPGGEEGQQGQACQHCAEEDGLANIGQRRLDEGRRPENRGVNLEAGSPGPRAAIAASMSRVTSAVLAPGNFWTTSMRPGLPSRPHPR